MNQKIIRRLTFTKHDHELLQLKNIPMYRVNTNKEVEWFVHMYISCDISFSSNLLQNVQQDQYM
jgi:hypothetical protein